MYRSKVQSSCILPRQTTSSSLATSIPTTYLITFSTWRCFKVEHLKAKNPSVAFSTGCYPGYTATQYSLHSVQAPGDSKGMRRRLCENMLQGQVGRLCHS